MALVIREADLFNPIDADAVRTLLQTYAADPMGGSTTLSPDVCENLIPRLRQVESRFVLLAEVNRQPAGLAIAFRVFSTFRAAPVLNLHDLAVHPDHRGRGIGRELLRMLEEYARKESCCRISLEVRHDNLVAQELYRSEGYSAGNTPQEFWIKPLN